MANRKVAFKKLCSIWQQMLTAVAPGIYHT